MAETKKKNGTAKGQKAERWQVTLSREQLARNFDEIRPPFSDAEAAFEAERCLYCEYDVPCVRGCPTKIDIPGFIRQIARGRPQDAAKTIFESNILGGVCARVCPVEKLCESLCICNTLHDKPISIGRLQRFATDSLLKAGELPFPRGAATGKRAAIIGAGPAGAAAAFELARLGHAVEIVEMEKEPGGLDRYGIAEYKIGAPFVRDELEYILQIGGIRIQTDKKPVDATALKALLRDYDAVLLSIGLGPTRRLGVPGEDVPGAEEAMRFIRRIKTNPLHAVPVGEKVVVIGAGNTAVDAATQARRLGAHEVVIAYRGGRERVKCTDHEFDLSVSDGCRWIWHAEPREIVSEDGVISGVVFADKSGKAGATFTVECDHLIKAIGQEPHLWLESVGGLRLNENRTVPVDPLTWMTTVPGLFAAGDCVNGAKEVVNAVYEGKRAALAMDSWMNGERAAFIAASDSRP